MGDFRIISYPKDGHKPPLLQEVQLSLKEFSRDQKGNICLTPTLASPEDVDYYFDRLIKRLQTLKGAAKRKLT